MISAAILKGWSESPRTLVEELAWDAVAAGCDYRAVSWKGATREPFLSLQTAGGAKVETVVRLTETNVTVHFWISPNGKRDHLKIKTT